MKPMEVAVYEKPVIVKIDTGTSPLIITDQGSGIVTVIDPAVIKAVTLSQDVTVKVNDGIHGKDGLPGVNGLPGKDGSRGMPGNSGIQGPRGIQGITGNRGPYGLQGPQGDIGLRGIQGPQGILGLRGAQGPYGVRGAQGPAGIVDLPTILPVITGNIDIHDFIPNHALTLDQLFAFWRAIGETLLTDYPNGLSLVEVIQSTTANSIIDAVVDLRASVDGQFILAYSYIDQTAYAIDQRVTNTQRTLNDKITTAESRILQTESSILSTVSRLTNIDGPGGHVSLLQSSIDQQADSLTLEVLARQGVDNDLQESKSRITMLDDTLGLLVETFDAVNDRLTTTEIVLDEKGIALSALESYLEYSISTQQRILKNSWGVVIEEDTGTGLSYISGVSLLMHPIWMPGNDYTTGDTIHYQDAIYECLRNHKATVVNNPDGSEAPIYWKLLPEGKKSEFIVKADSFRVFDSTAPDGTKPIFDIDTQTGAVIFRPSAFGLGDLATKNENDLDLNYVENTEAAISDAILRAKYEGETLIQGGYINTQFINTQSILVGIPESISEAEQRAKSFTQGWCTQGADSTLANIDNAILQAKVGGRTLIQGGYIETSLIKTSAIVIGDLSGASTVISNAAAGATFTGTTWANTLIGKAKLDTTVISGGYINTSLIKTSAIAISALSGASTVINNASNGAAYGAGLINGTYSAYNTNRVNGTAASTVVNNASTGAAAATTVNNWKYLNTTYIDGGNIYTNSITANSIAAGTITAQSAILANASVETLTIAGNAVTIPISTYTKAQLSGTSGVWATLQSATIISTGAPIFITFSMNTDASVPFGVRLVRNGTIVYGSLSLRETTPFLTVSTKDTPDAGTVIYTAEYSLESAGLIKASHRTLTLLEVKR